MAEITISHLPSKPLRKKSGLTIQTTDLDVSSFPVYVDPFSSSDDTMMDSPVAGSPTSRLLSKVKDGVERHLSPQPTHLGRVNGNGHRVLRSATVGYEAPEFEGKAEQMVQGT